MTNIIYNFNCFTNTLTYQIIFYTTCTILFLVSYIIQQITDKPCNKPGSSIIRIFHHFIMYYIYFGFLAPASILWIIILLLVISIISWIYLNNSCILTLIENKICGRNSAYIFHDITYFISKQLDKTIRNSRIYGIGILTLFALYRYYVYYLSNRIDVQGHRGARGLRPENTMSAFKFDLENDINTLELDLHFTKDKQIIIYHDDKINPVICKNGPTDVLVKNLNYDELQKYDCGSLRNPDFPQQKLEPGSKIPLFTDLIEFVQKNYFYKPIKMNVEIKTTKEIDSDEEVDEFTRELINTINKYNIRDSTIIQSFDIRALKAAQKMAPEIKRSYLVEEHEIDDEIIATAHELGVTYISPHYKLLNKSLANKLNANGFKIISWTPNDDDALKKLLDYDVYGIISDYPTKMKEYLVRGTF